MEYKSMRIELPIYESLLKLKEDLETQAEKTTGVKVSITWSDVIKKLMEASQS